jgi:CDP-diacylglycerol--glycerol-3-phosphate 3-phosphatidyltransferase
LLTVFRLGLGPAFILMHRGHAPAWSLMLVVLLALWTDWLDGFLARRWNAVSTVGKLLDPFADAIFCMLVFVDFAQQGLMPLWIVIILVARETIVSFILRPAALYYGIVVAAGMLGKIKTVLQFIAMLLVLLTLMPAVQDKGLPVAAALRSVLSPLTMAAFLAVLGFSVASAMQYGWNVVGSLAQLRRGAAQPSNANQGLDTSR